MILLLQGSCLIIYVSRQVEFLGAYDVIDEDFLIQNLYWQLMNLLLHFIRQLQKKFLLWNHCRRDIPLNFISASHAYGLPIIIIRVAN
ncbi:Retinoblastoma-related protein 1 [Zea mays]|uniref:Retinoblastoma-related protein 1 n=1 Tax=Zea mays TaxID=4577 RepID=A0A1D6F656_MAIZE|nr:Retinoblastoma-related protein 1 [Zea mays]